MFRFVSYERVKLFQVYQWFERFVVKKKYEIHHVFYLSWQRSYFLPTLYMLYFLTPRYQDLATGWRKHGHSWALDFSPFVGDILTSIGSETIVLEINKDYYYPEEKPQDIPAERLFEMHHSIWKFWKLWATDLGGVVLTSWLVYSKWIGNCRKIKETTKKMPYLWKTKIFQ